MAVDRKGITKAVLVMVAVLGFIGTAVGIIVDAKDLPSAVSYWYGLLSALGSAIRGDLPAIVYWGLLTSLTLANLVPWFIDRRRASLPVVPETSEPEPDPEEAIEIISSPIVYLSPGPSEPKASADSVQRLLELHPYWRAAANFALEYWYGDIYIRSPNHIVAVLIHHFVRPQCQADIEQLDGRLDALPAEPTQKQFDETLLLFQSVVRNRYPMLLNWIFRGGAYIFGEDQLLSSKGYAELYHRHETAARELERVRGRRDGLQALTGGLKDIHLPPPRPSEGPALSTASGPDQQP